MGRSSEGHGFRRRFSSGVLLARVAVGLKGLGCGSVEIAGPTVLNRLVWNGPAQEIPEKDIPIERNILEQCDHLPKPVRKLVAVGVQHGNETPLGAVRSLFAGGECGASCAKTTPFGVAILAMLGPKTCHKVVDLTAPRRVFSFEERLDVRVRGWKIPRIKGQASAQGCPNFGVALVQLF